MAFSKDYTSYTQAEQQLLYAAITKKISFTLPDEKVAVYTRHRLYSLRKALVHAFDQRIKLGEKAKEYPHLMADIVDAVPSIRQISIIKTGTTLTVNLGTGRPEVESVMEAALRKVGVTPIADLREAEIANAGDLMLQHFQDKPKGQDSDATADALSKLGFTTKPQPDTGENT